MFPLYDGFNWFQLNRTKLIISKCETRVRLFFVLRLVRFLSFSMENPIDVKRMN